MRVFRWHSLCWETIPQTLISGLFSRPPLGVAVPATVEDVPMPSVIRYHNGFTLVEAIVVCAVIGILASVSMANIPEWASSFRLRQSVLRLASTLQYVRLRAIATNVEYRVCFVEEARSYRVERRDGEEDWKIEGSPVSLPSSVAFGRGGGDPITFPGDAAVFRPDGSLRGLSGGVYFEGGNQKRYRVTVLSATGRVRVERGWGR